jgi:hypothetical protein
MSISPESLRAITNEALEKRKESSKYRHVQVMKNIYKQMQTAACEGKFVCEIERNFRDDNCQFNISDEELYQICVQLKKEGFHVTDKMISWRKIEY